MINKLTCEHTLPIPFKGFTKKEKEYFKKIKWDEMEFFTSSFFDYDSGYYGVSDYTISEDGQFYKSLVELELVSGDKDGLYTKEIDRGIERQDFTGEVYFGAEILKEDYDYLMTFRALFYKGDLKELDLEEWKKNDNKERKKAVAKIAERLKREVVRKRSLWYAITLPFKKFIEIIIYIAKWIMFKVFEVLIKIEIWAKK